MKDTILFVDTNIFLHFGRLDEVDWSDTFNAQRIIFAIPTVIVEELDRHKDEHRYSVIRQRARKSLELIQTSLNGNTSEKLHWIVVQDAPREVFERELRYENADDRFIAAAASYPDKDVQVAILTNDVGPKLKAHSKRLTVYEPLGLGLKRLPDAQNESRKEIRRLRLENESLKNTIPKMELSLDADEKKSHRNIGLKKPIQDAKHFIDTRMANIKRNWPELTPPPIEKNHDLGQQPLFRMLNEAYYNNVIPESEYIRYNQERVRYFDEYRRYLNKIVDHHNRHVNVVKLDMRLFNLGREPAENIDVVLELPEGVKIFKDRTPAPKAPREPYKPQTGIDSISSAFQDLSLYFNGAQHSMPSIMEPVCCTILDLKRVEFSLTYLKHHKRSHFKPVILKLENPRSFSFDYLIHAANIPEELHGKLHVNVVDAGT